MNTTHVFRKFTGQTLLAVGLPALTSIACASTAPTSAYSVAHRPGLETHTTTVDSPLARDLLHNQSPPELTRLLQKFDARPLTSQTLAELSAQTSPDLATAYFLKRSLAHRQQRERQERFARIVRELRHEQSGTLGIAPRLRAQLREDFVFLFVPGLFYRSKPESKSDMGPQRAQLTRLGYRTELLAVPEMGTVEANGRQVAAALRKHRNKQIILISASKGGPDIAYALGHLMTPADSAHVRAWVNVGGAMGGSPLADKILGSPEMLLARPYAWFKGGDACALAVSLSPAASQARMARQQIPKHIFILNYLAVPFSGDISPDVRGAYRYMRAYGPNDGIVRLLEQSAGVGQTVFAIGSDHRFRDPEIAIKTLALARIVAERVLGRATVQNGR